MSFQRGSTVFTSSLTIQGLFVCLLVAVVFCLFVLGSSLLLNFHGVSLYPRIIFTHEDYKQRKKLICPSTTMKIFLHINTKIS